MQVYLVGGAVRDQMLNRPVTERDWVVVGATPDDMLAKGFTQVGKDFPVFLHPQTREEYALARTERKAGRGYTGFVCHTTPDVTLEQDLLRRDLTVNAMAEDEHGNLIDPFNGKADLEQRILRHVSDAFVEDPLRVLRVARFAARYHGLGFSIAPETLTLMQDIAASGELVSLTAERVWKETSRALTDPHPAVYFDILRQCNALSPWFAELEPLWGIPNPAKWHPEIDTGIHTLMVVEQAVNLSERLDVRYAALVHDLGKAKTDPEQWPSHHGHEHLGLEPIDALNKRLKVPNHCAELARLVCQYHTLVHRAMAIKPTTMLRLFDSCDAWRKPERFEHILLACEADARGRTGLEQTPYPQADHVRRALRAAQSVDIKAIVAQGYQGAAIKEAIQRARLETIRQLGVTDA
ncbi:multifunctional CCA addition/repair protein [Aestuariibacter halophilus]|uniref:Multifunctional CCA protein n=1 Tax=Fluctibacter halophilus TaxID=226011 RepID=A0ABS8GBP5_9ALTE|nr:multifunctional CCA addition/repair protein [Aestuariibacter halophilus]MCC2616636.1 multifunctional CCA addition/repair protein [Aestuariibacter halophilus]